MAQLKWDPIEVATCLEVVPVADEDYGTQHCYTVVHEELTLTVRIQQYCGDVHLSLCRDKNTRPLIEFHLTDCSEIKYTNDQRGEYLDFAPAQAFGQRYGSGISIQASVRLTVKPGISIELNA
jgi:hypothetical protein